MLPSLRFHQWTLITILVIAIRLPVKTAYCQNFENDVVQFVGDPNGLVQANISSRFFGYDSAVNHPLTGEPSAGVSNQKAYDYSSHLIKDSASGEYRLYTGGRYRARIGGIGSFGGTVVDGDHVFLHTSATGLGYTWTNRYPSTFNSEPKPAPLFLQGKSSGQPNQWFSNNYIEPEVVKVNGTYYMYTQVEIPPGSVLDTGQTAVTHTDRIQLHTSADGINFTRFADRSVITNVPNPEITSIGHEEVMYVPGDATGRPFWMYTESIVNNVFMGHVRMRSNDPYTFNWQQRETGVGFAELGNQVGYIPNAGGAPLFTRITFDPEPSTQRWLPCLQFSRDGLNWNFGANGPVLLAGSTDSTLFKDLFFLGMSTIDGTGAWEEVSPGRYRVLYAGTTANSPVSPGIYDSEIGLGEMFVTLTTYPPGDYNRSGVVDAADYVLWRHSRGQAGFSLPADGNGNYIVDDGDYQLWRANFGKQFSAASASEQFSAVPEPPSWCALSVLLALSAVRRRAVTCFESCPTPTTCYATMVNLNQALTGRFFSPN